MSSSSAVSVLEIEIERIRELSKSARHGEALAAAEALTIAMPQNRDGLYLMAANQRCLNRISDALETLERLEQQHPIFSLLYQERGYCYQTLRDAPRAIDAFLQAVDLNPALITSWVMLERLYGIVGDVKNAATAAQQVAALKELPPEIVRAGSLFSDGNLSAAENTLRTYMANGSNHPEALRLLARINLQQNVLHEAEPLLEQCLNLAPTYCAARLDYIRVLMERQKYLKAQEEIKNLLSLEPDSKEYRSLSAAACVGLGLYEEAIALYRQLLSLPSASRELHVALGHCLKSIGQQTEAIECYRAAAAIKPGFGDAYWSMANLKTYRFSQHEIADMRTQEAVPTTRSIDRYHLCFAPGKAYEDRNEYAESWEFYERGNGLKRAQSRYDPEITEANTRKLIEVCTMDFFAARVGFGAPHPDPIFIVGLPRSGSTLIEQMLSSHSEVEGTQELADIPRIVADMRKAGPNIENSRYPAVLRALDGENFRGLAERYISDTRIYRGNNRFFIDKMPNNFQYVGLIHLMLPNAKIIDVRREPMACCFSNLKQLFASGQEFTYSINDIARYYRSYLDLMQHWDAVLPGRVLRICYEDVVEKPEENVRRILKLCDLQFEPACVNFYNTKRSVRTPSSEQVRQPVFRDGLFQWRNYECWLGPLKDALSDALIRYRE